MTSVWSRVFWFTLLPAIVLPRIAYSHGFGQRYDLPVPLWLYLTGAGLAVSLSFVVMALFVRQTSTDHPYPRVNLLRFSLGRLLTHRVMIAAMQLFSVGLLILVIYTGAAGTLNQNRNFAVVFVWVIWWVGLAYFSALVGDLWLIVNPWKVTFEWAEALFRILTRSGRLAFNLPYPKWLGVWPGVLLFWAFAWIELVYYAPSHPPNIALMAINYSYITWIGMLLFGKQKWLRRGEAFSSAFSLLARFAPTEFRVVDPTVCGECQGGCRDRDGECINCYDCFERARKFQREWNLRPFAVGLMRNEGLSLSHAFFVLLLLSSVTFDGLIATPLWESITDTLKDALAIGRDEGYLERILPVLKGRPLLGIFTLGLTAVPLMFAGIYLLFCGLMSFAIGHRLRFGDIAGGFVYSLVPIALAYHLAHYLTFLLIQGQWIIPLISDPLAWG